MNLSYSNLWNTIYMERYQELKTTSQELTTDITSKTFEETLEKMERFAEDFKAIVYINHLRTEFHNSTWNRIRRFLRIYSEKLTQHSLATIARPCEKIVVNALIDYSLSNKKSVPPFDLNTQQEVLDCLGKILNGKPVNHFSYTLHNLMAKLESFNESNNTLDWDKVLRAVTSLSKIHGKTFRSVLPATRASTPEVDIVVVEDPGVANSYFFESKKESKTES